MQKNLKILTGHQGRNKPSLTDAPYIHTLGREYSSAYSNSDYVTNYKWVQNNCESVVDPETLRVHWLRASRRHDLIGRSETTRWRQNLKKIQRISTETCIILGLTQSCPWVGLTHGLGSIGSGWVEIFQFLVGCIGLIGSTIAKVLNFWKDYVDAFKARLDKIWLQQAVKFDFMTDLTGTENWSEGVIKW